MQDKINKQEILEEFAEIWNEKQTTLEFGKPHNAPNRIKAFIEGAKWQQEQIYNEIKQLYDNENINGFSKRAYAQCLDIVEQFKNK